MLEQLRNFDSDRANPDEMVALHAFARVLEAEYQSLGLHAPEWVAEKKTEVKRELDSRLADMKAKRVREIKQQLATLKTAAEKRADLEAELQRLSV